MRDSKVKLAARLSSPPNDRSVTVVLYVLDIPLIPFLCFTVFLVVMPRQHARARTVYSPASSGRTAPCVQR